ncbi:hypothetical protein [Tessaracoccus sp. OH4464_COT-324]|uniref:hypothetical protein n=1 Tax=Tessaracoccus sp. OH4464_COT-324 TaxID=2491059 RepID=UPI000F635566|nr:hypothetical protein [Tessaracoccus sp. OH4464_COT-324]RRD45839.1 hypothetical protein EII42_09900 [Tessaracoccus sp. OH4464_COT-324]
MTGRHEAPQKNERRAALLILGIGSAAALSSTLGSLWVVRAGVGVAVIMAILVVWVVFREIDELRKQHAEELRNEVQLRIQAIDKHHAESVALIERFNARAEGLNNIIQKLRSQLAAAKAELSSMRGNAAWLRAEVAERQARVAELETRVAELERKELDAAERLVDPQVEDIWSADEHPTVIDLSRLQIKEVLEEQDRLEDQARSA